MVKKDDIRVSVEDMRAELGLRSPDSPDRLSLDEKIYDMKLGGASVREISVGCSVPQVEVEAAINRMAEAARSRHATELSIATILEIDRMDRMLKALWPQAEAGDGPSIDRIGSISKERRRLLGLDAVEVKASLNVSSADQMDLSVLSLDELKAYQAIQQKLTQVQRLDTKRPSRGRAPRTLNQPTAVIDVTPEPDAEDSSPSP